MTTRGWGILAFLLAIVIIVLAWFLFTTPASAPTLPPQQATSTTLSSIPTPAATSTTGTEITVTTPTSGATVTHMFEIAGIAPNQWFFEAVFPIQTRDPSGNVIGSSQGQAQGDWTQQGPVTFTSQMTIESSYEGPAMLVLSKDNPSGSSQNAEEVTIPILVQ